MSCLFIFCIWYTDQLLHLILIKNVNTQATSTLKRINLKTAHKNVLRPHLSFSNCFAFQTETLLRRDCDKDHMVSCDVSIFKKFYFSETENVVLVWTKGQFKEKKLCFQFNPEECQPELTEIVTLI